jgi:hypothetical protein
MQVTGMANWPSFWVPFCPASVIWKTTNVYDVGRDYVIWSPDIEEDFVVVELMHVLVLE